jgi:Zn-dependent metalloprotease
MRFFCIALFLFSLSSLSLCLVPTSSVRSPTGKLTTAFGEFGRLEGVGIAAVSRFLKSDDFVSLWQLNGDEEWVYRQIQSYRQAVVTYRFDQKLNGLSVFGGELAVHVHPRTNGVFGVSGSTVDSKLVPLPRQAIPLPPNFEIPFHNTLKTLLTPRLKYIVDEQHIGHLAWVTRVMSTKPNNYAGLAHPTQNSAPEPFDVYIDAITHEYLLDIPLYKKALDRTVFDCQNTTTLPGQFVRSEGMPPASDPVANQAYDNAGYCYNFYWNMFGRDSYDDKGSPLNSSIHYGVLYNNAFWNGEQMVYGDGDGVYFADFANDLGVICHELTHAVTQSTSNLRYWSESGALNEGFSDIMGSSSVVYTSNPTLDYPDPSVAWLNGINVTLVNLNPTGCYDCPPATRYMNNPPLDGHSTDYYPDRYTGFEDNRGVHSNSGIANLAYVLTVQGGAHPQQKSSIFVFPIGIQVAQQIYYLGFTQFLTSTSVFADARAATIQAANILYSDSPRIIQSTTDAWTTVGVEGQ